MAKFAGVRKQNIPNEQRVDTRRWGDRMTASWSSPDGAFVLAAILIGITFALLFIPGAPILAIIPMFVLARKFLYPKKRLHDGPFRLPKHIDAPDGSIQVPNKSFKKAPHLYKGKGVTLLGVDLETRQQVWSSDSDNRTHGTILGTTGSGKSELIFSLLLNQLVEDSGFIAVDAKGDIAFQYRCCQLLRRFGREDDLLTISFAVGGRDFLKAQPDRPTNTFNIMSSTSAGMLIELLSGMLDGDGGDDMWKGRAIAFIAAITRPLTYLRDSGDIELSPSKYMDYMELAEVERLVYEQASLYPGFDVVLEPLRGYLTTLPGYDTTKKMQQAQETNEQFGYITMQLTRAINDLGHNYGHIFGTEVGEIDISDVVLNRRCLTVLLPSLERSLPTLNMLGKLIIGSIKQMMAGSLGSSLDGLSRLIVDSRPTSANNSFRIILDEVGYMMVTGMSVIFAQARSLNISMIAAAQSYTDIKRGSAEEAEAIWDNSNMKYIGRIVGGDQSETWQKVKGAAGERIQMYLDGYEQKESMTSFNYVGNKVVRRETKSQVDYQDGAGQELGEFTLVVPKKYQGGRTQGVSVTRLLGLYTGDMVFDYMYVNDLIPLSNVKDASAHIKRKQEQLRTAIKSGSLSCDINKAVEEGGAMTAQYESNPKANITRLIQACEKEIDAHKSNPNFSNIILGSTLNLLASTLKSIDSDKYYMPTNLLDGAAQEHVNNALESNANYDITESQAKRAVHNFQNTSLTKDTEIQSSPVTYVYDQDHKDANNNPFDNAQPEKAEAIQTELQKAHINDNTDIAKNKAVMDISKSIVNDDKLDENTVAQQTPASNQSPVSNEVLPDQEKMKDNVDAARNRHQQLTDLISKQNTDSVGKDMLAACINDGILTPATSTPILNEKEQDELHKKLVSVAAYALSSSGDN